jgi:hypothetical protein
MRTRFSIRPVALSLVMAAGLIARPALAVPPIRTVALNLDPIPNLGGNFFNAPYLPVIDAHGRVAFSARTVSTSLNTSGIWYETGSTHALLARQSTAAPGGGTFGSFGGVPVWLSDTGRVMFSTPALAGDVGIWGHNGTSLVALARIGGPAPFSSTFSDLPGMPYLALANNGSAVFRASTSGANNGYTGLIFGQFESLALGASTLSTIAPIGYTGFGALTAAGTGNIGLNAGYNDGSSSKQGLYFGPPNALNAIVSYNNAAGTPAPFQPSGVNFQSVIYPPGITSAGNALAFTAYLRGPGIDNTNTWSLWLNDNTGGLRQLIRQGDQVPGLPVGWRFIDPTTSSPRVPVVSESRHIALYAPVQTSAPVSSRQTLIRIDPQGNIGVIAYEGGPAAGLPAGSTILNLVNTGGVPCMNVRGQLIYVAYVTLPDGSSREVVYATSQSGASRLLWIVNETQFEIRSGIFATLSSLTSPFNGYPLAQGGDDGRRRCFNAQGQFVFPVNYTRVPSSAGAGTGVFVITASDGCNAADLVGVGGSAGGDGQLTADDVIAFLAAFFAGNTSVADLVSVGGAPGGDGQLTADDVIAFLSAFFAPCP